MLSVPNCRSKTSMNNIMRLISAIAYMQLVLSFGMIQPSGQQKSHLLMLAPPSLVRPSIPHGKRPEASIASSSVGPTVSPSPSMNTGSATEPVELANGTKPIGCLGYHSLEERNVCLEYPKKATLDFPSEVTNLYSAKYFSTWLLSMLTVLVPSASFVASGTMQIFSVATPVLYGGVGTLTVAMAGFYHHSLYTTSVNQGVNHMMNVVRMVERFQSLNSEKGELSLELDTLQGRYRNLTSTLEWERIKFVDAQSVSLQKHNVALIELNTSFERRVQAVNRTWQTAIATQTNNHSKVVAALRQELDSEVANLQAEISSSKAMCQMLNEKFTSEIIARMSGYQQLPSMVQWVLTVVNTPPDAGFGADADAAGLQQRFQEALELSLRTHRDASSEPVAHLSRQVSGLEHAVRTGLGTLSESVDVLRDDMSMQNAAADNGALLEQFSSMVLRIMDSSMGPTVTRGLTAALTSDAVVPTLVRRLTEGLTNEVKKHKCAAVPCTCAANSGQAPRDAAAPAAGKPRAGVVSGWLSAMSDMASWVTFLTGVTVNLFAVAVSAVAVAAKCGYAMATVIWGFFKSLLRASRTPSPPLVKSPPGAKSDNVSLLIRKSKDRDPEMVTVSYAPPDNEKLCKIEEYNEYENPGFDIIDKDSSLITFHHFIFKIQHSVEQGVFSRSMQCVLRPEVVAMFPELTQAHDQLKMENFFDDCGVFNLYAAVDMIYDVV